MIENQNIKPSKSPLGANVPLVFTSSLDGPCSWRIDMLGDGDAMSEDHNAYITLYIIK